MDPNPWRDPAYSPSTCLVAVVLAPLSLWGSSAVAVAAVEPLRVPRTPHRGRDPVHPRLVGLDSAVRPVCLHRTLVLHNEKVSMILCLYE